MAENILVSVVKSKSHSMHLLCIHAEASEFTSIRADRFQSVGHVQTVQILDDATHEEITDAIEKAFRDTVPLSEYGWRLCKIGPPPRPGLRSTIQPYLGVGNYSSKDIHS